jgi:hypothetical protein
MDAAQAIQTPALASSLASCFPRGSIVDWHALAPGVSTSGESWDTFWGGLARSKAHCYWTSRKMLPCNATAMGERKQNTCCIYTGFSGQQWPLVPFWGVEIPIADEIGAFVRRHQMTRTLEVGLAQGTTALSILKAHADLAQGGIHVNVQPDALHNYDAVAPMKIKELGLDAHSRIISALSHVALPALLACHGNQTYDMILVDGRHTFDVTLLDMYYADLLLRTNGTLLVDDKGFAQVKDVARYWNANRHGYAPCSLKRTPKRMLCYVKVSDDAETEAGYTKWLLATSPPPPPSSGL